MNCFDDLDHSTFFHCCSCVAEILWFRPPSILPLLELCGRNPMISPTTHSSATVAVWQQSSDFAHNTFFRYWSCVVAVLWFRPQHLLALLELCGSNRMISLTTPSFATGSVFQKSYDSAHHTFFRCWSCVEAILWFRPQHLFPLLELCGSNPLISPTTPSSATGAVWQQSYDFAHRTFFRYYSCVAAIFWFRPPNHSSTILELCAAILWFFSRCMPTTIDVTVLSDGIGIHMRLSSSRLNPVSPSM